MSDTVVNLDRLAAQHAQALIKNANDNIETTITKTLGILQEDGVYACFLYLLAREKENGKATVKAMLELLKELGFDWEVPMNNGSIDLSPDVVLKHITDHVTQNLERLLLTKETLEQMLIYARYGAKAREAAKSENKPQQEE